MPNNLLQTSNCDYWSNSQTTFDEFTVNSNEEFAQKQFPTRILTIKRTEIVRKIVLC